MERELPAPDTRIIRAARSLYVNQRMRALVEGRIDRATDTLVSYLGLAGVSSATLGTYAVAVVDGALAVNRLETPGAHQLPLPNTGVELRDERRPRAAGGNGTTPQSP